MDSRIKGRYRIAESNTKNKNTATKKNTDSFALVIE